MSLLRWGFYGLMVGALALAASGCGGGSGGGKIDTMVDPASAYKGVLTQAVISQNNAESVALGGFGGGGIAGSIRTLRSTGNAPAAPDDRRVRQFSLVLKKALNLLDIPKISRQKRSKPRLKGLGKVLARSQSFVVNGESGGAATLTLDINDSTNSFSGNVVFSQYASQSEVVSGSADVLGTLDPTTRSTSRLTLSFSTLTISEGRAATFDLTGTMSWGSNSSTASETLSMNMVLLDQASSRTYWFNNYVIDSNSANGTVSEQISGRYFDPLAGYVDLASPSPVVGAASADWPSGGGLQLSGSAGTWVRISFYADHLLIEAETNGGGDVDWQQALSTNTQAPVNSPPVAVAGANQHVVVGATVSLDGSGSHDPDGDALTYSWQFQSCPNYSCPSLSGSTSATPSFTANQIGTYVLGLSVGNGQSYSTTDTLQVVSSDIQASDPNLLQMNWQYWTYGSVIGMAGIFVSDLDGDGKPEVITSASVGGFGSNAYWYILREGSDGKLAQVWRSETYQATLVQLALADLNGDGHKDIVAALSDGTVIVYDGVTRAKIATWATAPQLEALAVADIDGDGKLEIVTSDGVKVFVYDCVTGGLKWSLSKGGGSSIAIGNVDADSHLEIVTTSTGGKGYVIDGATQTVKWEYVDGFGARVALGDLDGDGKQEIVGASSWYKITVFDAERKTPSWEVTTSENISALLVADVDGDGIPEIIYGDAQWGPVHGIDARTHTQKWSISNPDSGVSGIAVGDVDLDGKNEVLFGAGGNSTGADYLYVGDPLSGNLKWQSVEADGPYSAVAVGDIDSDGRDEIVMVSNRSDSGYGEGIIHVFDAQTHVLKFQQKLGIMDWMGVRSVQIGDVDGDGKNEFVVTTASIYGAVIQVYDGSTCKLKKQSAIYQSNYFTSIAIADIDNDGHPEIVLGQGRNDTGATGTYLVVLDGATLQEKWRSTDLEGNSWGEIYDVKVADLDGDGHPEIVASLGGSRLVIYDGVTHDQKLLIEEPARALQIADIDGDGVLDILVGRTDGKIDVFDGKTFALKKTTASFAGAAVPSYPGDTSTSINAITVADLTAPGSGEWIVATNGRLEVIGGAGTTLKWRSAATFTSSLGLYNHISVKDVDNDGKKEIFVGDDYGLYQFR